VRYHSEVEAKQLRAEKMSRSLLNEVPVTSYSSNELETDTSETPSSSTPIDFSDIIARTNVELKVWAGQISKGAIISYKLTVSDRASCSLMANYWTSYII
jgi:hypothetical protein